MTATYDGKLVLREKTVDPCCRSMGDAICLGTVKIGTANKVRIVKISVAGRWFVLRFCPFCGAEVMA